MNVTEPYAVSVEEACRLTRLGRTKIYELLGDGRLRRIKIDKRTLIGLDSIKALFNPGAA